MSGFSAPGNNADDIISDITIDSFGRIVVVGQASFPATPGGNFGFGIRAAHREWPTGYIVQRRR